MNWKNITIEQLQELASINHFEGVERRVHQIAIVKRLDIDEVEEMSLEQILKEVEKLSFLNELPDDKPLFAFKHYNKRYRLITNAQEMNAHHFIELQQIKADDIIENLHKILAMLSYRVDIFNRRVKISKGKIAQDFEQRCEDFKSLRCDIAYSYAVFSLAVYPLLLNATLSYLKQEMSKLETT
jgi:hypothetical protein